jgi:large subunit ribosomal protein L28
VCGRSTKFGNSIARRGKAKYLGGVGRKVTGITRRHFRPNLQKIRVTLPDGTPARMTVCVKCIQGGRVTKRVKRVIPPKTEK